MLGTGPLLGSREGQAEGVMSLFWRAFNWLFTKLMNWVQRRAGE